MQTYVEWQRWQLDASQNYSNVSFEGGGVIGSIFGQNYANVNIIRKTGNTSALAIGLAFSHLLLIFCVPEELKQELYYIIKVYNDLCFCVFINRKFTFSMI